MDKNKVMDVSKKGGLGLLIIIAVIVVGLVAVAGIFMGASPDNVTPYIGDESQRTQMENQNGTQGQNQTASNNSASTQQARQAQNNSASNGQAASNQNQLSSSGSNGSQSQSNAQSSSQNNQNAVAPENMVLTESVLDAYIRASKNVTVIRSQQEEQNAIRVPENVGDGQQDMQNRIVEAIQNEGLSMEQYQYITMRLQNDPLLRQEYQEELR